MTNEVERRLEERSDCAIAAKIEISGRPSIAVVVTDISISGVRLQVGEVIDLSDKFDLLIPVVEGVEMRHRVKVAWRRDDIIGGEFLRPIGPATDALEAMDAAIKSERSKRKP